MATVPPASYSARKVTVEGARQLQQSLGVSLGTCRLVMKHDRMNLSAVFANGALHMQFLGQTYSLVKECEQCGWQILWPLKAWTTKLVPPPREHERLLASTLRVVDHKGAPPQSKQIRTQIVLHRLQR